MDRKNLVNQSIDYIMGHLDEDLSLDRLAALFLHIKIPFQPDIQGRNRTKAFMRLSNAVRLTRAPWI